MATSKKHFGKFRGTVVNNVDPMQTGRLMAQVPDVLGVTPSSWALPCFPVSGKQIGVWALPQVGANVWVEFEQGDPGRPVWTGCFPGSSADVPALALAGNPASPSIVLQTGLQNAIAISDAPGPAGGIVLRTSSGAMIAINDAGITIANGKGAIIALTGPSVNINGDALTVD